MEHAAIRHFDFHGEIVERSLAFFHWPGNNPEQLVQNAVLEWGQNAKDLDFFWAGPDAWFTENYVAYRGGLPTWRAIRTIASMAGLSTASRMARATGASNFGMRERNQRRRPKRTIPRDDGLHQRK